MKQQSLFVTGGRAGGVRFRSCRSSRLWGLLLLAVAGALLWSGCYYYDDSDYYPISSGSWFSESGGRLPVQAGGDLFFMDREAGEMVVVGNREVGQVKVERVPVCDDPGDMLSLPDGRVGVMCAQSRLFVAVQPGEKGCKKAQWKLDAPFDQITISADGKAGVAYFSSQGRAGAGLGNPHQLGLVDLDRGVEGEFKARWVSLPSHGALPERVDVGPGDAQGDRRLVVVGSDSYVLVLDHQSPEGVVYVPLTVGAMEGARVRQALFLDDGVTVALLVKGAEDVFLLTVPRDGGDRTLRPSINPAPAGRDPVDLIPYKGSDDRDKLLVLNHGTPSLTVIDLASLQTKNIALSSPANRITVTGHPDGGGKQLAVLYKAGSRVVQLVDLPDVETSWVRAVSEKILNLPLQSLWIDGEQDMAVIIHDGDSNLPLTVLNLKTGTLAPLSGGGGVFSSTMDYRGHKLFVVLTGTPPVLTWIHTGTLMPGSIDLIAAGKIYLLPERNQLAVVHRSDIGLVSFYDLGVPAQEKVTHVQGFLLAEGVNQ